MVVTGPADDGDRVGRRRSGEGSSARTVTGEAAAHALVHTGDRVQCVVARGGVALRTGSRGRDVVRWLARPTVEVAQEGGRRRVTAAAVTRGRVRGVVLDRPVIALRGHRGADQHAEELRTLVTGLTRRHHRGYRRVAGTIECRRIDVRRTELEASRVHVGGRVTARAAAVEAADRDVVVARPADDGDRVGRWRPGEGSSACAVTGEAAR